jgi:hypothetical protein
MHKTLLSYSEISVCQYIDFKVSPLFLMDCARIWEKKRVTNAEKTEYKYEKFITFKEATILHRGLLNLFLVYLTL